MRLYENPEKTSENRLESRSWYIPSGDAVLYPLNGEWRFAFFENGDKAVAIDKWDNIDVPSCWQLKGYENPNYTNINYPFPCDPPYVPDINPVGIYERTFNIENYGNDMYLMLEGVSSCAKIYVNGQYVGFTQGSRLPAEFDISSVVRAGTNTIRIYVRKWCCGSYLEDQDAFRYNGIFRDIYLLSRPKGHIFELDIRTDGNKILCKTDKPCSVELYDGEQLLDSREANTGYAEFTVESPHMWTAETPYLYTVKFSAAGEEITRKIGFRTIEISNDYELLVNGVPVKLKGVNHHDTDPEKGWTMSEADILRDLKLMKSLNINCIRTSHYPPSPKFLDFCDELGFYVILETDIETHGFLRRKPNVGYGFDVDNDIWPCASEKWKNEFMSRMERAYECNKTHTSIIIWSTGNESGYGKNQDTMIEWLKSRDNVRLAHCEDASRKGDKGRTDVFSAMYPSVDTIDGWAKDDSKDQPVFLCEYAHAMGNGPGGIWDYWKTIYANKKLIGGCIWEWADHVVLDNGVQKYGGDFEGEMTDDGNFCCDGMVFSNRSLKPGSYEIKNTYAPFRIKWENGTLKLKNCFDFTSFDGYSFEYDITVDGESIEKRIVRTNTLPHEDFTLTPAAVIPESCKYGCFITVRMFEEETELGCLQERLPVKTEKPEITASPIEINKGDTEFNVIGDGFSFVVSKQTGAFISIIKNGEEQLKSPSKISFARACTDNDINMKPLWNNINIWQGENLDCVFNKIYSVDIKDNKAVFTGSSAGVSRQPFFKFTLTYDFFDNGSVKTVLSGKINEETVWLPRLGFEFELYYQNDKFRYFGNGPLESYCDMTHHGTVDFHESNADSEYVNYVRPQEHGNHTDCSLLEFTDSLKFEADTSMEISVLHNTISQIEKANHTDELKKSGGTQVRIDYKVSGIGSNSCGPQLQEKYRLNEKNIDFGFILSV